MILPCARTLVDVLYPFEVQEAEIFTTSSYLSQDDIEDELHPVEGEVIDLMPCIIENVLLAIPFRVFSEDEAALSQAVLQGEGWEYMLESDKEDSQEQGKTIHPRLKKLQSLLNDSDREEQS